MTLVTSATSLVVMDMAGTTIVDDGIVEAAFQRAAERTGVVAALTAAEALAYVRDTMGQSKLDVFTHLADGDRDAAGRATAAFEAAYGELIVELGAESIAGAEATLDALADAGIPVVLTTGFAPVTRDAILDSLGWHERIVTALSPADVGRGRPAPDLVLAAALRVGVPSMQSVVVVGDTASDVASGLAAGAGRVFGVRSGAHDEAALRDAGAHDVLASVAELPRALGLSF